MTADKKGASLGGSSFDHEAQVFLHAMDWTENKSPRPPSLDLHGNLINRTLVPTNFGVQRRVAPSQLLSSTSLDSVPPYEGHVSMSPGTSLVIRIKCDEIATQKRFPAEEKPQDYVDDTRARPLQSTVLGLANECKLYTAQSEELLENRALQIYQLQLMLLAQRNKRIFARQEIIEEMMEEKSRCSHSLLRGSRTPPESEDSHKMMTVDASRRLYHQGRLASDGGNEILPDYQHLLSRLEEQNNDRLRALQHENHQVWTGAEKGEKERMY